MSDAAFVGYRIDVTGSKPKLGCEAAQGTVVPIEPDFHDLSLPEFRKQVLEDHIKYLTL